MKSTTSIPHDLFYNPAAALPVWYSQARPGIRRKADVLRIYTLEHDNRKAEVVCSVILTCCLLVAFAHCVVQFALS